MKIEGYAKEVEAEKVFKAVDKKEQYNAAEAVKAESVAESAAEVAARAVATEKDESYRKEVSFPSLSHSYL